MTLFVSFYQWWLSFPLPFVFEIDVCLETQDTSGRLISDILSPISCHPPLQVLSRLQRKKNASSWGLPDITTMSSPLWLSWDFLTDRVSLERMMAFNRHYTCSPICFSSLVVTQIMWLVLTNGLQAKVVCVISGLNCGRVETRSCLAISSLPIDLEMLQMVEPGFCRVKALTLLYTWSCSIVGNKVLVCKANEISELICYHCIA